MRNTSYTRGGQIAAREPHLARGNIQEKYSNLKFPSIYDSKY